MSGAFLVLVTFLMAPHTAVAMVKTLCPSWACVERMRAAERLSPRLVRLQAWRVRDVVSLDPYGHPVWPPLVDDWRT